MSAYQPDGRFRCEGSPLDGRAKPMGWDGLRGFQSKARALRAAGMAATWEEACSLLGRHAAAVKRARKEKTGRLGDRETGSPGPMKRRWWDR